MMQSVVANLRRMSLVSKGVRLSMSPYQSALNLLTRSWNVRLVSTRCAAYREMHASELDMMVRLATHQDGSP